MLSRHEKQLSEMLFRLRISLCDPAAFVGYFQAVMNRREFKMTRLGLAGNGGVGAGAVWMTPRGNAYLVFDAFALQPNSSGLLRMIDTLISTAPEPVRTLCLVCNTRFNVMTREIERLVQHIETRYPNLFCEPMSQNDFVAEFAGLADEHNVTVMGMPPHPKRLEVPDAETFARIEAKARAVLIKLGPATISEQSPLLLSGGMRALLNAAPLLPPDQEQPANLIIRSLIAAAQRFCPRDQDDNWVMAFLLEVLRDEQVGISLDVLPAYLRAAVPFEEKAVAQIPIMTRAQPSPRHDKIGLPSMVNRAAGPLDPSLNVIQSHRGLRIHR